MVPAQRWYRWVTSYFSCSLSPRRLRFAATTGSVTCSGWNGAQNHDLWGHCRRNLWFHSPVHFGVNEFPAVVPLFAMRSSDRRLPSAAFVDFTVYVFVARNHETRLRAHTPCMFSEPLKQLAKGKNHWLEKAMPLSSKYDRVGVAFRRSSAAGKRRMDRNGQEGLTAARLRSLFRGPSNEEWTNSKRHLLVWLMICRQAEAQPEKLWNFRWPPQRFVCHEILAGPRRAKCGTEWILQHRHDLRTKAYGKSTTASRQTRPNAPHPLPQ